MYMPLNELHSGKLFPRRDMEEADRKRREEFKTYEMEKKFEQHERLNHIDDEEKRKEEEKRMKEGVRGPARKEMNDNLQS